MFQRNIIDMKKTSCTSNISVVHQQWVQGIYNLSQSNYDRWFKSLSTKYTEDEPHPRKDTHIVCLEEEEKSYFK